MSNRILRTTIEQRRVSPMEAEVWIVVEVEGSAAGLELRGRLHGPKCAAAATVQIAYAIRAMPRPACYPDNTFVGRVLIPEPNLWTPELPFVYDGAVELWQDEKKRDETPLRLALKSPLCGHQFDQR